MCARPSETSREVTTSSVRVGKIRPAMFADVHPLLREFNPRLGESTWRQIFDPPWETGEDYCGYGLFDDDRVVGFLGLIFSRRTIDDRVERFCNLTAWYVRAEYRAHSLSLILPVLRLRDHTVTDLSPSSDVVRISRRLGFETLDSSVRLLLPVPGWVPIPRSSPAISFDKAEIAARLTDDETLLVRDHADLPFCHQMLVDTGSARCLIIYTVAHDTSRPYCHVHHVGNQEIFATHGIAISRAIARESGVWMQVVDPRLVKARRPPMSVELPPRHVKLYRSRTLGPEQIDNLYSELVLLDIRTANSLERLGPRALRLAGKSLADRARSIGTRRERTHTQ